VSKRRSVPDGHNDRDNERRASVRQTDGSSAVQNGRDAGADISIKRRRFPLCSSALPLSPTEPSVSPHWTSVKRKSRGKVSRVACRRAGARVGAKRRGVAVGVQGAWHDRSSLHPFTVHSPSDRSQHEHNAAAAPCSTSLAAASS